MKEPIGGVSDSHGDEARQVARGGSLNLVGTGFSALAIFVLTWVVARGFSTEDAGVFFAATSLFLILVGVAEFGADSSLPRFVPLLRHENKERQASQTIFLALLISVSLGAVLGIALVALRSWIGDIAGLGQSSVSADTVLIAMALAMPTAAAANVLIAATRSFHQIRPTVVLDRLVKPSLQLAGAAVGVLTGSALVLLLGWLVPMLLLVVPAWVVVNQLARSRIGVTPREAGIGPRAFRRQYWKYTIPRAIARILQIVLQRADVVLVAIILSPTEAAIYAVATRLIVLVQFGGLSFQQVLAPNLSRMISRKETRTAFAVARTGTGWTMLIGWPICLLSITAGPLILGVIGGADYVSGAQALAILGVGMLASTAVGPVDTILLMAGRSGLSLIGIVSAVTVNLVLLFALTPTWGIEGAAFAWSAALLTKSLLAVLFVRVVLGETAFGRPGALVAAASLIAFLIVPAATQLWTLDFGLQSAAVLSISLLVYSLLIWRFRDDLSLASFAFWRAS